MYVVEFNVKPGVCIREGTVGPMFDKNTKAALPGGGHQVQFLQNAPFSASQSYVINPHTIRELR